jgi:hypothetical protein
VPMPHDKDCCCARCLGEIADLFDRIEKVRLAGEIQASWHRIPIDENGPYAGYQPWLPVIPRNSWFAWFAEHDAPRRQIIRDLVLASLQPSSGERSDEG